MPKDRYSARREQARELAAAEGIKYTEALRRLDQAAEAGNDGQEPVVRKSKKVVREHAAATGRTYLDAASSIGATPPGGVALASDLRDSLADGLEAAGWPVVIEHHPEATGLRLYAGPATISVERQNELSSFTGDEHPDDPDTFDLSMPLRVIMWAPLVVDFSEELGRVGGVDAHEIPSGGGVSGIIAEIDRVVGQARQCDQAEAAVDTGCGICGDSYPAPALLEPTTTRVGVCPACAFDGDLLGAHPAQLAFQLDQAATKNLALAAGWAGVQALLCCLGGDEFYTWLKREWTAAGTVFEPLEWWHDPGQTWIWLPPADRRPSALADFGCGACLTHIAAAIDQAHPDLRAISRANRADEVSEYLEDGESDDLDDATLEQIWPAAIAYAVALLTQKYERPTHRAPWHVMESFELAEWLDELESDLDYFQVESVLGMAIPTILNALDPDSQEI
ncbi:hypothetical protein AB0J47_18010 [Nocardia sp. NPDC049737]|uniref:hypothetical protein n=1 Tax=Nocardia sp. NPDC049737 TaxID=3154358 RepID=UPI003445AE3A